MAYLHLQDGGLTPTAGIEKQEYSHIVADSYSALMAYEPERGYENLEAVCSDGATYTWNGTAWAVSVINNGATYVAQHPTMQAASVRPTDKVLIDRNGNSMVASAGVIRSFDRKSAVTLGDSITAQTSACSLLTSRALGYTLLKQMGYAGKKIEDMASHIPEIVSLGADTVFLQVGTNNVDDTISTIYVKYISLLSELVANGLKVIFISAPPHSAFYSPTIHKINLCAYYACRMFGIKFYDPWSQFALVGGGWSVPTVGNDSVHPDDAARVTASNSLISLLRNDDCSIPALRTTTGSMFANPCFATYTGGTGLSDSWTSETTGTAGTFTRSADGTLGKYKQEINLVDPVAGTRFGFNQTIASGFSVGDYLLISAIVESVNPSGKAGAIYLNTQLSFLDSGDVGFASAVLDNATAGRSLCSVLVQVPAGTAKLRFVSRLFNGSGAPQTGTFYGSLSSVNVVNLTTLGITQV